MSSAEEICIAFVCVENAGRSQMAAAFARREKMNKDLPLRIISGGTDPAEEVHEVVIRAMRELDFDLSNQKPRLIKQTEIANCDYVITMGCSAKGVCPGGWEGTDWEWNLDDPGEAGIDEVRTIRDDIRSRVKKLTKELFED